MLSLLYLFDLLVLVQLFHINVEWIVQMFTVDLHFLDKVDHFLNHLKQSFVRVNISVLVEFNPVFVSRSISQKLVEFRLLICSHELPVVRKLSCKLLDFEQLGKTFVSNVIQQFSVAAVVLLFDEQTQSVEEMKQQERQQNQKQQPAKHVNATKSHKRVQRRVYCYHLNLFIVIQSQWESQRTLINTLLWRKSEVLVFFFYLDHCCVHFRGSSHNLFLHRKKETVWCSQIPRTITLCRSSIKYIRVCVCFKVSFIRFRVCLQPHKFNLILDLFETLRELDLKPVQGLILHKFNIGIRLNEVMYSQELAVIRDLLNFANQRILSFTALSIFLQLNWVHGTHFTFDWTCLAGCQIWTGRICFVWPLLLQIVNFD